MDKEFKNVVFVILTLILNVLAPILVFNTIQDYTKTSQVYGLPYTYEVSEYINSKDYLFQENLSTISYTAEQSGDIVLYTYNYHFEAIDLDTSKYNYGVFVNDYICTIDTLDARSITSTHLHDFYDINKTLINSVELNIEFKSYTTYSTLLITITATNNDLTYWNNYCTNPGFVLTLSKMGTFGNLYIPTEPQVLPNLSNYYIDLERLSALTSEINGLPIDMYYIEYFDAHCLKLVGSAVGQIAVWNMNYIDKNQSIMEIIEAQRDVVFGLHTPVTIDANLVISGLNCSNAEDAIVEIDTIESPDGYYGHRINNLVIKIFEQGNCSEYSLSFKSDSDLGFKMGEELAKILENDVYNNEEVEISYLGEKSCFKVNNYYVLNY